MSLYTERHGIRKPIEKTYNINKEVYNILFNCCEKYKKNLTHIFTLNCHHDFTNSNYITFDEKGFISRIKIKIPSLFQNKYDQFAILDYIEFFAQKIQDISENWNNPQYKNFQRIECFNTSKIFNNFRKEIDEIFCESGLLYKLTNEKIIERIVNNTPLSLEIENSINSFSEVGTKNLLKDAITLYKTPYPSARQDSVEKIWDALERLKTYYIDLDKKASTEKIIKNIGYNDSEFMELFNDEFKKLTYIGNNFRIRHHETNKKDIIDPRYYDYLFNRCLSLIAFTIQYLN